MSALPEQLSHEVLAENPHLQFVRDMVKWPDGAELPYLHMHRVDPGPVIIAIDQDDKFIVLREWRYPIQGWAWSFAAGGADPGESMLDAAKREFEEETGITAETWIDLGPMIVDPGANTQVEQIFLAKDLTFGEHHQDPHEFIEIKRLTRDELFALIEKGENISNWLLGPLGRFLVYEAMLHRA